MLPFIILNGNIIYEYDIKNNRVWYYYKGDKYQLYKCNQYTKIEILTTSGTQFVQGSTNNLLFGTNNTERMRIDSSGNLLVGTTSSGSARLRTQAQDSAGAYYGIASQNSSGTALLLVRSDGYLQTGGASASPYNLTTASAANVYVGSDGGLYRSTSSLKYKTDVKDAVHGLKDLLKLRSVTYEGKSESDIGKTFGGLIAEKVMVVAIAEKKSSFGSKSGLVVLVSTSTNYAMQ